MIEKEVFQKQEMNAFSCDIAKQKNIHDVSETELDLESEEKKYSSNMTFQSVPDYVHRKIAGMDALISIGQNIANFNGYIELNESAALLWENMSTPKTFDELRMLLEQQYELTDKQATEDLLEFINMLQEHGMIKVQCNE